MKSWSRRCGKRSILCRIPLSGRWWCRSESCTISAMQWVLHGNLSSAVSEALKRFGHDVHTFEELGLKAEPTMRDIVWTANKKQWDLVTNDAAIVKWIYDDGFPFRRSLVFLQ